MNLSDLQSYARTDLSAEAADKSHNLGAPTADLKSRIWRKVWDIYRSSKMASKRQNKSLDVPRMVMDERDPLWSSLDNLTVGMSPQERSQYLINMVAELTDKKKPDSKE